MKRIALIAIASFVFYSVFPSSAVAFFGPNTGDTCGKKSETKKIDGKAHICEQARDSKFRWLVNSSPSESDSALGLVLSSCGSSFDGKYSVFVYPRMMFGALVERGIADGQLKQFTGKQQLLVQYDIDLSNKISTNLEMAATLDSKWRRINDLWISGINASYSRWSKGGANQIEAINASQSNIDLIEGICRVASTSGDKASKKELRTVLAWMERAIAPYKN
jgi:hypothetical protein